MELDLRFAARTLVAFVIIAFGAARSAVARDVVLQDNKMLAAFDSRTGALTKLIDKTENWTIERRPDLGISFRMLVPLANRQDNFVLGQKQNAVKVEKISKNEVVLMWQNLLSGHGGVLPIKFTATVSLNNGVLKFEGTVSNNSSLTVQTIDYPYFGDLNPPSRNSSMAVRTMWYGDLGSDEIYPNFVNYMGYYGVFYPTKTFDSYKSLFCLIQSRNPNEGIYVEMDNPNQPYLIQYTFEQHPGVLSWVTNAVPRQDEISGKPVHLEFRTCHFTFTPPHSVTKLAPVVVQCYHGDWYAGVDIYKKWRETWFKEPHIPQWVENINSWQQLQIDSPVQDWRVPYDSLLHYGKECAADGVSAIQLVGWNDGGQDADDPSMSTDPHLGTWQQLHDAIAQIQAMGVHIILFGKLSWADLTTQWYKKELYRCQTTDPYGVPYEQDGYSYYTPVQLADINSHRRAVMDFLDPAYRDIATGEFRKLLSLGASGWLYDEVCWHGMVIYNFAKGHGYTPPGFIYAGDEPMAKQLRAAADSVNPDFLFAGEGPQDWLTQYYPVSYFRIGMGSTPVCRYIDPYAPIVVAITGFDDRETINLCLLYRYIIEYEPRYFKGHLNDFPLTLTYGRKVDALRRRYKAYLWDADFRGTMGAKVTANGFCKYSVFVTKGGKRAVVVANMESEKLVTAKIELPHSGKLVMATPGKPDARPTSGTLRIAARSAAVVMEQ